MNIYVLTYIHYDNDGLRSCELKKFYSSANTAFRSLLNWFKECYNILDKKVDWKIESVELDSNRILGEVTSGHADYKDVDRWNYTIYLYRGNEVIEEIPLSRIK